MKTGLNVGVAEKHRNKMQTVIISDSQLQCLECGLKSKDASAISVFLVKSTASGLGSR